MLSEPHALIHWAVRIVHAAPIRLVHELQARIVLSRLRSLMPTTPISLSVSDPISAMIIAALTFLSTPAGQQICADIRQGGKTIIGDLIGHIHAQMPAVPAASAVPAPIPATPKV